MKRYSIMVYWRESEDHWSDSAYYEASAGNAVDAVPLGMDQWRAEFGLESSWVYEIEARWIFDE